MRHDALETGLFFQLPTSHFHVKQLSITLFMGDRVYLERRKVRNDISLVLSGASMPEMLGAGKGQMALELPPHLASEMLT